MAFAADGGFELATKRHKPEEIVAKLRQVDVLTGKSGRVQQEKSPYATINSDHSKLQFQLNRKDLQDDHNRQRRTVKKDLLGAEMFRGRRRDGDYSLGAAQFRP
jgi:hypothetical protein